MPSMTASASSTPLTRRKTLLPCRCELVDSYHLVSQSTRASLSNQPVHVALQAVFQDGCQIHPLPDLQIARHVVSRYLDRAHYVDHFRTFVLAPCNKSLQRSDSRAFFLRYNAHAATPLKKCFSFGILPKTQSRRHDCVFCACAFPSLPTLPSSLSLRGHCFGRVFWRIYAIMLPCSSSWSARRERLLPVESDTRRVNQRWRCVKNKGQALSRADLLQHLFPHYRFWSATRPLLVANSLTRRDTRQSKGLVDRGTFLEPLSIRHSRRSWE